jgi:tetratricopeptide (TPR) repeat protein
MPLPRFALLLLATLSLGAASLSAQSADPADEYFRAYLMNNEAERLVQGGELARAVDKYQQALAIFESIAKTNPTWQSQMLTFRRSKIADAIANAKEYFLAPRGEHSSPSTQYGSDSPSLVSVRATADRGSLR